MLSALTDEYMECFTRRPLSEKHTNALIRCMEAAIKMAFSTVVPLLYQSAADAVDELHPVVRAVCALFCRHLCDSWFGLENDRLYDLYSRLRNGPFTA